MARVDDLAARIPFDGAAFATLRGARFFKLCGSGNDFVGLDGRVVKKPSRAAIAALCDRRFGIGADGVVWLAEGGGDGRVRLDYWNSDGSDAALCGNGSLCAAVLARRLELVRDGALVLETGAGAVAAEVLGRERARIGVGAIDAPRAPPLIAKGANEDSILHVVVGVPHLVVRVEDPARVDLQRRGAELRFHPSLAPAGANVNFVAGAIKGGAFALRTYERGVEGETLACGTGATATALALMASGLAKDRAALRTASGEILAVTARKESERFSDVRLEGQGRIVFEGVVS